MSIACQEDEDFDITELWATCETVVALKAEALKRYIAAGGDPADFEADYPAIRAWIMANRMADLERRVADPADYARGDREQSTTFSEPTGE